MENQPPSVLIVSVLIVEDELMSRRALARLVKTLGFKTLLAGDLATARRVLSENAPHILILDLMLPDGDGQSLLAEIRRDRRPITVAVVTAVSNELRLHEVTALKPDALFGKPVDIGDFKSWLMAQCEIVEAAIDAESNMTG